MPSIQGPRLRSCLHALFSARSQDGGHIGDVAPFPGQAQRACRAECHGSGDTGTWARVPRPSLGDSGPGLASRTLTGSLRGSGTRTPSAQLHVSQYCRFCMKHHPSPFPVSPPYHELPADPAPPFMPPQGHFLLPHAYDAGRPPAVCVNGMPLLEGHSFPK